MKQNRRRCPHGWANAWHGITLLWLVSHSISNCTPCLMQFFHISYDCYDSCDSKQIVTARQVSYYKSLDEGWIGYKSLQWGISHSDREDLFRLTWPKRLDLCILRSCVGQKPISLYRWSSAQRRYTLRKFFEWSWTFLIDWAFFLFLIDWARLYPGE